MIVIDMDMPTSCRDCYMMCADIKRNHTERPQNCPIKCDIEDIRAEIKSIQKEDMECDGCSDMGMVLDIIDKQTAGSEDKK